MLEAGLRKPQIRYLTSNLQAGRPASGPRGLPTCCVGTDASERAVPNGHCPLRSAAVGQSTRLLSAVHLAGYWIT